MTHDLPGVRMTFRHVDATFPKYFMRTYGPQAGDFDFETHETHEICKKRYLQAPFEIILAINPIVEMIGTPLMTGLLLPLGRYRETAEEDET